MILQVNFCSADEAFYVSRTFFNSNPSSSLAAETFEDDVVWYDDASNSSSSSELEIGVRLPRNFGLIIRKREISGSHAGEASQYVCFFGFCSYVGSSLISGNTTTDTVDYKITSTQIMLDHSYSINKYIVVKPRIGVNVFDATVGFSGTGNSVTVSEVIPVPMIGLNAQISLNSVYSIEFDGNYFGYDTNLGGLEYIDASIGLSAKISNYFVISAGYKNYLLSPWYLSDDYSSSIKIDQESPFIAVQLQF
jgi:hypothetical protein